MTGVLRCYIEKVEIADNEKYLGTTIFQQHKYINAVSLRLFTSVVM